MRNVKILALAALSGLAVSFTLTANSQTKTLFSDTSLTFKDGMYFTFDDLKANKPNVLLSELRNKEGKTIEEIKPEHMNFYFESEGANSKKRVKDVFAFVVHGHLFAKPVAYPKRYVDFPYIGALSIGFAEVYNFQTVGNQRQQVLNTELFVFDWETGMISDHYYPMTSKIFETRDKKLFEDFEIAVDASKKYHYGTFNFYNDFFEIYNKKNPVTIPQ